MCTFHSTVAVAFSPLFVTVVVVVVLAHRHNLIYYFHFYFHDDSRYLYWRHFEANHRFIFIEILLLFFFFTRESKREKTEASLAI